MARLRRSRCAEAGIERRRHGRGFSYRWPDGRRVTEPATLDRIAALAVPPAWRDVWICPWPNGHIQAVGTDAAGRRQYRYHDAWRTHRDREKFDRVLALGRAMPSVRQMVGADLGGDGLGRERVLAAVVRLLDLGAFRIGGEQYAAEHETFGVATLRKEHVSVRGDVMVFEYPAKGSIWRSVEVADPEVLDVVRALRRRRGGADDLFAWKEAGHWVDVRSDDVNLYVKEAAGEAYSAKDFRTWSATVLAAVRLAAWTPLPSSRTARRRAVVAAVKAVAAHLGNTPAVCRASYVDPRVVDAFEEGRTVGSRLAALSPELPAPAPEVRDVMDRAVVDLLEHAGSDHRDVPAAPRPAA